MILGKGNNIKKIVYVDKNKNSTEIANVIALGKSIYKNRTFTFTVLEGNALLEELMNRGSGSALSWLLLSLTGYTEVTIKMSKRSSNEEFSVSYVNTSNSLTTGTSTNGVFTFTTYRSAYASSNVTIKWNGLSDSISYTNLTTGSSITLVANS